MPTAPTTLRSRLRAATLVCVFALVALASLLAPSAAPAKGVRARHATSHSRIANTRCALKRGKKSSSHRSRSRSCATRPHGAKAPPKPPAAGGPTTRGLVVESLGGSPPVESSTSSGTSEAPGSTPGNGDEDPPGETGEVLSDPIDPQFLTDVPFGTRSFWIQPWRAYLDTWPASTLLESLGINFNVSSTDAEDTAQLLQETGFKLARIEINWSSLSYSEPNTFVPARLESIATRLSALHKHGLRPLILLDANSLGPTPSTSINLETTSPAPAGAQTVRLTAASAAEVVPGKSGFDGLSFGGNPDVLISSVSHSHVATLSTPLLEPLAAGAHAGTTLLYAPFEAPKLANGEANPAFQATLDGWLGYVAAVCKEAASIVGPGGYDLEVWNELSFGSQFLNSENYYPPAGEGQSQTTKQSEAENGGGEGEGELESENPKEEENEKTKEELEQEEEAEREEEEIGKALSHKREVNKEIRQAVLNETVAYVRNPANGISANVGITDGFASQTPFPSGANAPLGLTALSKHPYAGPKNYPAEFPSRHLVPINALGVRDTKSKESFTPLFIPTYQSLLPEFTLTATSTETMIRDLAPFTTDVYHDPHGRNVTPPGGGPVQTWVTEYNLSPGKAQVMGPDEVTPQTGASATLTAADKEHFQAKVALRSLVSMVGKGVSREYFYAAAPGHLSLISPAFFSALASHPHTYPGEALGGETISGLHNMLARFQGPGPGSDGRALTLLSIAQDGNHAQFAGDTTAAHPSLYDRDVLAVFPFQVSPTSFVIPVYVMTRDLLTLYEPDAPSSDINRFDLPDETFRITLGNLPETSTPPSVNAYDPLRNQSTPAQLVSREGSQATFELAATDYPRILTIDYPGT